MNSDAVIKGIADNIFTPIYEVVAALAVVYFLYGVAKFIMDLNNPDEKNNGKSHLLWGLVGLFIIFSIGGIMSAFGSFFGSIFK